MASWAEPVMPDHNMQCSSMVGLATPGHAMPNRATLHHAGLHGTMLSPTVAVPTGNSTTQHSHAMSHGEHVRAAPFWEATGQ